jgi:hypothetical protein
MSGVRRHRPKPKGNLRCAEIPGFVVLHFLECSLEGLRLGGSLHSEITSVPTLIEEIQLVG